MNCGQEKREKFETRLGCSPFRRRHRERGSQGTSRRRCRIRPHGARGIQGRKPLTPKPVSERYIEFRSRCKTYRYTCARGRSSRVQCWRWGGRGSTGRWCTLRLRRRGEGSAEDSQSKAGADQKGIKLTFDAGSVNVAVVLGLLTARVMKRLNRRNGSRRALGLVRSPLLGRQDTSGGIILGLATGENVQRASAERTFAGGGATREVLQVLRCGEG